MQQVKSNIAPQRGFHAFMCNSWVKPFFMRVVSSPATFPGVAATVELSSSLSICSGAGKCGGKDSIVREETLAPNL